MYNYFRRYLIVSTKIHRKLLMQKSNHESILSPMINCYASSHHIWNNSVYKQFYCQIANNEKIETSVMKNNAQRKLDEVLSNLEDLKRYQILELEIDVMRHNAEKVPEKLNPDDWLLLLKLPSKRQRK